MANTLDKFLDGHSEDELKQMLEELVRERKALKAQELLISRALDSKGGEVGPETAAANDPTKTEDQENSGAITQPAQRVPGSAVVEAVASAGRPVRPREVQEILEQHGYVMNIEAVRVALRNNRDKGSVVSLGDGSYIPREASESQSS